MIAEHPLAAWSETLENFPAPARPRSDLATLLLAVNYELLGYAPEQAWMFAQLEGAALADRLDG